MTNWVDDLLSKKRVSDKVLSKFRVLRFVSGVGVVGAGTEEHTPVILEDFDKLQHALKSDEDFLMFSLYTPYNDFSGFCYRTSSYKSMYSPGKIKPQHYLYGYKQAQDAVASKGYTFLVEGLFDTLRLHDAGLVNTVSSLGAHLSYYQASLISRSCDLVFIVYDGDSAGNSAAYKAKDIFKYFGTTAVVVTLPAGMDPDDYINTYGAGGFETLCLETLKITQTLLS